MAASLDLTGGSGAPPPTGTPSCGPRHPDFPARHPASGGIEGVFEPWLRPPSGVQRSTADRRSSGDNVPRPHVDVPRGCRLLAAPTETCARSFLRRSRRPSTLHDSASQE